MAANVETVCAVLDSVEGLDCVAAEDLKTGEQMDYRTGSPKDLKEAVEFMDLNFSAPFRLRAWKSSLEGKPGSRKASDKPFVWTMLGRSGAPAPVNGVPAPARSAGPSVDVDTIRSAARAEADVFYLRSEVERLIAHVEDLESEADESAANPIQAAPAPAPLRWWESPEGVKSVSEAIGLRDIIQGLGLRRVAAAAPPAPAAPVAGLPSDVAGLTDDERELVEAVRVWRKVDPEQSGEALTFVRGKYGREAVQAAQRRSADETA